MTSRTGRRLNKYLTLDYIKRNNAECDHHFFDRDTMRFFRSRVSDQIHPGRTGEAFLVTSEQGPSGVRRYSVRRATGWGCKVDTAPGTEFQGFKSSSVAHRIAASLAAKAKGN